MKNYILLLALTFATGAYYENPYQDGSTVTANGKPLKLKMINLALLCQIQPIFIVTNLTGAIKMVENWRRKTNMLL